MRCPERHMQVVSHQNERFLKIMKIFFFQWIVWHWRVLGRWRVQDLQEYQVFFFSSNRRDLDLEVDKTQLSL